jgi:hypothetical protein
LDHDLYSLRRIVAELVDAAEFKPVDLLATIREDQLEHAPWNGAALRRRGSFLVIVRYVYQVIDLQDRGSC